MRAFNTFWVGIALVLLSGCGHGVPDKAGQPSDEPTARDGLKAKASGDQPVPNESPDHAGDRPKNPVTLDALEVDALKNQDGQWARVKGKVLSTHLAQSGKAFTLNIGPDWKTCFKAVVFQEAFEKWTGGMDGIKAEYTGKQVVVEGKIKIYNGSPEIVVNTPSQVEVAPQGDK